jgi:hypothetical protein
VATANDQPSLVPVQFWWRPYAIIEIALPVYGFVKNSQCNIIDFHHFLLHFPPNRITN